MCRSIKVLRGMEPPATRDDMQAAALQFIRKVSGFRKPSRANEAAFQKAVDEVAQAAEQLLGSLNGGKPDISRTRRGTGIPESPDRPG